MIKEDMLEEEQGQEEAVVAGKVREDTVYSTTGFQATLKPADQSAGTKDEV